MAALDSDADKAPVEATPERIKTASGGSAAPAATESPSVSKFKFTDTMLVGLATLFGYAIAFSRELGFALYFHLPLGTIAVGVAHVLLCFTAAIVAVAILILIGQFWYLLFAILPVQITLRSILARFAPVILYSIVLSIIAGPSKPAGLIPLVMALFYLTIELISPLIGRKEKGYWKKLEAQEQANRSAPNILRPVAAVIGTPSLQIFFYCMLALAVALVVGDAEARKCESYYCIQGSADVAVLRFYGDTTVAARYSPSTKRLTGEIWLMDASESSPTRLQRTRIGPLLPPDRPSTVSQNSMAVPPQTTKSRTRRGPPELRRP